MNRKLLPLLVILLLAAAYAAPTVTKTVIGPTLLDFGDKLAVNVSFSGDKLLTLRDPIPVQFSVVDLPALCAVSAQLVTCNLKGADVKGVSYTLVALSMGEQVFFNRAMLDYDSGGTTATAVSNSILTIYQVGFPRINATGFTLSINGQKGGTVVLPNSDIVISITLKNEGATEAKSVAAAMTVPTNWAAVGPSSASFESIRPAESFTASYSFKAPPIAQLASGEVNVSLSLSWFDSLKNNTQSSAQSFTLLQAKPNLEIKRTAYFEWKKEGNLLDANGTLEPVVYLAYTIENKGNEKGFVSLAQELPLLSNVQAVWANPMQMEVAPGEKIIKSASGKTDQLSVAIPAATASVSDRIGNDYPSFTFAQETVVIGSTIWSTIFIMTKPYFPKIQLAAIILFFLLAGYIWKAKGFIRLAVAATIALCLALLYSTYTILF